jgi:hypothetical protein
MILKAKERGGGQQLARYLLAMRDNDHVELHEVRGFASEDLRGAFREADAIALGTRCEKHLFAISLNPPEGVQASIDAFEQAIDEVERKLGLENQPRAIVFHEKDGRRHADAVWSRIDAELMRAINLPHYKIKLRDVSRKLYLEHGWDMPRGLQDRSLRDPLTFTRQEWQQATRAGLDARELKAVFRQCWEASDNKAAFDWSSPGFVALLRERGECRHAENETSLPGGPRDLDDANDRTALTLAADDDSATTPNRRVVIGDASYGVTVVADGVATLDEPVAGSETSVAYTPVAQLAGGPVTPAELLRLAQLPDLHRVPPRQELGFPGAEPEVQGFGFAAVPSGDQGAWLWLAAGWTTPPPAGEDAEIALGFTAWTNTSLDRGYQNPELSWEYFRRQRLAPDRGPRRHHDGPGDHRDGRFHGAARPRADRASGPG